jgi:hypothetical protein
LSGIWQVSKHLAGVEGKVVREHLQVDGRILVAGKAHVPHLALAFCLRERLHGAIRREVALGIVVVRALVDLPQVEDVGLQPLQRLFELAHGLPLAAAVRAQLRHEEHLVAPSRQRLPHDFLAAAVVIFPRVVHEGDSAVDRGMHDPDRLLLALDFAEVIPSQAERRDQLAARAERPSGNSGVRHVAAACNRRTELSPPG